MHRELLLPPQRDMVADEPGVGPHELRDDSVRGTPEDARRRRLLAAIGVRHVQHLPCSVGDGRIARVVDRECEGDDLGLAGHLTGGSRTEGLARAA